MRIVLLLCLLGALFGFCEGQQCIDGNCQTLADLSEENRQIAADSEAEIRKWFWYYLRGARLLYATIIESKGELFMFYIHRNIVGTFQTVSAYEKAVGQQTIKNLVRLGAGASADVPDPTQQTLDVIPSILSIELKPDQYLVTLSQQGQYEVVGANFESEAPPQPLILDARARLPLIEQTILQKYPHYLSNSQKLSDEIILTTERVYFLLTFINPQGLFLAIGSDDSQGHKQVNTFVRLGKGTATAYPERINLDATVIELQ